MRLQAGAAAIAWPKALTLPRVSALRRANQTDGQGAVRTKQPTLKAAPAAHPFARRLQHRR